MMNEDTIDQEKLDRLERAARALPESVPPERDLWPGIEARLQSGAQQDSRAPGLRTWSRPLLRIAAAVALMAVSSLVTLTVMDKGAEPETASAPFGKEYMLGPNYVQARNELALTLDERLERLEPETRKVVVDNLREIRDALNEINAALIKNPSNVLLQQLLLATYQEELEMFNNVNRMTESLSEGAEI